MKNVFAALFLVVSGAFLMAGSVAAQGQEALIQDAVKAAPESITKNATIQDWEGNVLRKGTNGWTCLPTPPQFPAGTSPMCLDATWMEWADAWANKKDFSADRVGLAYMLAGDSGASNIDPYATEPTADNDWVVSGAHLMMLVPDATMLEGIPTDPMAGGPFVMWKGTPYAHVMIPIEPVAMKPSSD